jgi:malonate transporter MadM subunit
MVELVQSVQHVLIANGLLTAFAVIGAILWISYEFSARLTRGKLHGSAIAIFAGLALAYAGGCLTGGKRGLADLEILAGIGLMGGAMLRDLAITATAFGVDTGQLRQAGRVGILALLLGVCVSFLVGAAVAYACGYRDAVAMTTIGAGAGTYIVGPVTGTAIGADSDIIALSITAGLIKAILTMALTPLVAPWIGLNNPRSAMIYGGLMGTTSGVAAGLAAVDPKLVPYGAMTATFFTGIGCLLGPSLLYLIMRTLFG